MTRFAAATELGSLGDRLTSEGMQLTRIAANPGSLEDARETASLARDIDAKWIVVDGYHFRSGYQRVLRESGLSLLVVDDQARCREFCADLLLNQNLGAEPSLYAGIAPRTPLLLGARFTLLRREFERRATVQKSADGPHAESASGTGSAISIRTVVPPRSPRILVTMGGSDSGNATQLVVHSLLLAETAPCNVKIVVGSHNPHRQLLRSLIDGRRGFEVCEDVQNMAILMDWADLAISASGSTVWELASRGVPALLLVLADNQQPVAEAAEREGIGIHLGRVNQLTPQKIAPIVDSLCRSPDQLRAMSDRGPRLIDGQGADRVVQVMRGMAA